MNPGNATDKIIDLIASVERRRRKIETDSGLAAACNESLRQLHELLDTEQEALQADGPETRHSAHIETVAVEIKRVKKLLGNTRRDPTSGVPRPGQMSPQSVARSAPAAGTAGRWGRTDIDPD